MKMKKKELYVGSITSIKQEGETTDDFSLRIALREKKGDLFYHTLSAGDAIAIKVDGHWFDGVLRCGYFTPSDMVNDAHKQWFLVTTETAMLVNYPMLVRFSR